MSTCALTARRVSPHSHLPPTRGGGPRLAISPYAPCERRGPSSHSAWHSPRGAWNVEAARSHTTDLGLSSPAHNVQELKPGNFVQKLALPASTWSRSQAQLLLVRADGMQVGPVEGRFIRS